MKEEKYIQSLFEKARREQPVHSYEEVSHDFDVALNPTKVSIMKDWFFNHLYLNTFIVALFILSGFVFLSSQPSEQTLTAVLPMESPALPVNAKSTPIVKEKEPVLTVENKVAPSEENKRVPAKESIIRKRKNEIKEAKTQITTGLAHIEIVETNTTEKVVAAEKDIVPAEVQSATSDPIQTEILTPNTKANSLSNTDAAEKIEKKANSLPNKIAPTQENRSELEIILETALNTDELKKDLFLKNRAGKFQQLIIKTNNKFDDLIDIQFAGKKAIVLRSGYDGSFNIVDDKFVDVQRLMIEENDAILEFIYNSELVQIELERIDDQWVHKQTHKTFAQQDHFVRQELMQILLDDSKMVELIKQDENSNAIPFAILSNGNYSDKLKINFDGKELEIISYKNSRDFDRKVSYVKITIFQVKRKTARLEFSYQGNRREVNFKKKNGEWILRSFKQL